MELHPLACYSAYENKPTALGKYFGGESAFPRYALHNILHFNLVKRVIRFFFFFFTSTNEKFRACYLQQLKLATNAEKKGRERGGD